MAAIGHQIRHATRRHRHDGHAGRARLEQGQPERLVASRMYEDRGLRQQLPHISPGARTEKAHVPGDAELRRFPLEPGRSRAVTGDGQLTADRLEPRRVQRADEVDRRLLPGTGRVTATRLQSVPPGDERDAPVGEVQAVRNSHGRRGPTRGATSATVAALTAVSTSARFENRRKTAQPARKTGQGRRSEWTVETEGMPRREDASTAPIDTEKNIPWACTTSGAASRRYAAILDTRRRSGAATSPTIGQSIESTETPATESGFLVAVRTRTA